MKFCLWPHFMQQLTVSCVAKWEISTISLTFLAHWLSKPWHSVKFQYLLYKNLPFLKLVKGLCNLIKQSYCLHLNKGKLGIFRCKIHRIYTKCLVYKNFINIGIVPYYIHTSCNMLVQYPIVSILCFYTNTHSIYTICLVEVYSMLKCIKFT